MNCVIACSPRPQGNTDLAANLVGRALEEYSPGESRIWRVADCRIRPCVSCGCCASQPGRCALDAEGDQAMTLLRAMGEASCACLLSPVYFYHFPAQAKALLDRAQSFWRAPSSQKPGRGKSLGVVLICARARGDKLTRGSMLSLRYVAQALGMDLADPLILNGLDEADALRRRPDLQERVRAYARLLGQGPGESAGP